MAQGPVSLQPIVVGDTIVGFAGGFFGSSICAHIFDDKRVEAIGPDWVVVRAGSVENNWVFFATSSTILTDLWPYCRRNPLMA